MIRITQGKNSTNACFCTGYVAGGFRRGTAQADAGEGTGAVEAVYGRLYYETVGETAARKVKRVAE